MEKFIIDKLYQRKIPIETKRADNVKIVRICGEGVVYVCPFPETHYSELVEQTKRMNSPIKSKKFI